MMTQTAKATSTTYLAASKRGHAGKMPTHLWLLVDLDSRTDVAAVEAGTGAWVALQRWAAHNDERVSGIKPGQTEAVIAGQRVAAFPA